ncbi:hypothetical protein [Streptosporangium sp. NPDC020145]|uniref:hypothetical protein n=1 Tax=Streptosporangium sp. NPDC020145 TaxID=3154694 RepID=UPI0034310382
MNDEPLGALSDGTFRAHWLRELLRSSQLTESVKVLLFSVAIEEMDAAGRFSVPREELAVRIGRGKTRITERLTEAVAQGFLVRLAAGRKKSTAVYAAALKGSACPDLIQEEPDPGKGPDKRTERKGPDSRTRTIFGSDLQAPNEGDEVRIGGPQEARKGPPIPATNRYGSRDVGDDLYESADDGLFLREAAAPRRASPDTKKSAQPRAPKTSIPADFAVDPTMRAWATEKCPDVDLTIQTQLFINHFMDKPEIKRPGWVRSWQSWMLRQQGWTTERQSNVRQLRPTGTHGHHQPYRNPTDQSVYDEEF